uniref:Ig-like domain-containing protein n=1 Tax=Urocitellus parryii TaxID=9999 RepID=A0A8D2KHV7_UROPR
MESSYINTLHTEPGVTLSGLRSFLFYTGVSSEDKVVQSPPSLVVHEGDSATFNCSYEMANFQSLHWYKQEEKAPTFLFILVSSGAEKKLGRLSASLDTMARLSTLHITDTQYVLSATYFCALVTQCSHDTVGLYPNLQLVP